MMVRTDFPSWSVALYGSKNVAQSCLRLQDRHGLDVNAVLFCYWHGAHRGIVGEDLWPRIDEISRQWQNRLIRPLREARRWLKKPGCGSDPDLRKLRERIKADEIAAELLQQRMMQQACASARAAAAEPATAARRNAEALLRRRGVALAGEVEVLLEEISKAAFT